MGQRFLSREEAQSNAILKVIRKEANRYRPKGKRYDNFPELYRTINPPVATWTYRDPNVEQGTMVVMHKPNLTQKEYKVLAKHQGSWYCDFPSPPYLLYQRYEWMGADTVYVCEGERTSDVIEALGLPATTSLGGPFKAALSDWKPLKEKHVIILSDFDDKGRDYARKVAQLCLDVGAISARIVMFPGLKVGQGPTEWIDRITAELGRDVVLGELEKLVAAAEPVTYVPPAPKPRKGARLDLRCLSDVAPSQQEWIFESVIPRGELTLLTGDPNSGKSRLALNIAAGVTRGIRTIHVEQQNSPAAVILFSPDEGLKNMIRPQLEAAGADLSMVHALEQVRDMDEETGAVLEWSFQLHRDLPLLEAELVYLKGQGIDLGLIVIDPVDHFLGTAREAKSTNWTDISMQLGLLAKQFDVAIVLVSHLPNSVAGGPFGRTIRRSINTKAFAAAARSVWLVTPDFGGENRRLLLPCKTNLSATPLGFVFYIEDHHIEWRDEPILITADEYLKALAKRKVDNEEGICSPRGKLAEAIDFVSDQLKEDRVLSTTIKQAALDAGITIRTLWRALLFLDGESKKVKGDGKYYWGLPHHWKSFAALTE